MCQKRVKQTKNMEKREAKSMEQKLGLIICYLHKIFLVLGSHIFRLSIFNPNNTGKKEHCVMGNKDVRKQ